MKWLMIAMICLTPWMASAERNEAIAGLYGGAHFPGFRSQDPTDFLLATWSAGAWAEYGLLDDVSVGGRFVYSQFDALDGDRSAMVDGFPVTGDARFALETWHAQLMARYTLLAGYSFAPRLHLAAGYVWQIVGEQYLDTPDGSTAAETPLVDEGRGAFTLAAGVMVDYRIFDLVMLGVGVEYTRLLGDHAWRHAVSAPITLGVFW